MASKLSASRSKRRRTVSWWELLMAFQAPFPDLARSAVDFSQGHESKPPEQRLQALCDRVGAEVVQEDARERELEVGCVQATSPRRPRWAEPALVELVRVEVEHRRASARVYVLQGAQKEPGRQQAEVATARDGEAEPAE